MNRASDGSSGISSRQRRNREWLGTHTPALMAIGAVVIGVLGATFAAVADTPSPLRPISGDRHVRISQRTEVLPDPAWLAVGLAACQLNPSGD